MSEPMYKRFQKVRLTDGGDDFDGKVCIIKKVTPSLSTYEYYVSCEGVGDDWFFEDEIACVVEG